MRPWPRLILLVLALAVLTHYANGWPTDNRVEIWLHGRDGMQQYGILQQRFGGDEMAMVRVKPESWDDSKSIRWTLNLGPRLLAMPTVTQVVDPFRLVGAKHPGQMNSWKETASRPLGQALDLVGQSSPHLDFLLRLDPTVDQDQRNELATELEDLRVEAKKSGVQMHIAGHPLVAAALDVAARQVQKVFAPLLALVATLGVWALLRSLPLALLSVLPALLGASAIRAAFRVLEWDSNLILVSAGPLMLVILLASALHLCSAYLRFLNQGLSPMEAARHARKEKITAGLWAALTTSIGFAVFLSSPLEPVRRLGIGVALGVLFWVPAFYFFLPELLTLVRKTRNTHKESASGIFFGTLACTAARYRRWTIPCGVLLILAGAVAFQRLETNTNALRYFPDADVLKQDFAAIEASGTGLTTVEVLVRHTQGDLWNTDAKSYLPISQTLEDFPNTRGTFGPSSILRDLESRLPQGAVKTPAGAMIAATGLHQSGRVGAESEWARWTLRMASGGSDSVLAPVDALRTAARDWDRRLGLETIVTGTLPLLLDMQDALIGTLLRSLGLTLIATFLIFLLVTRHWRERCGALVVNLIPVACSLLASLLLGFELDGASVMVAAVVLSLAVDNTFHLLHAFRDTEQDSAGMQASFARVGPPAAISAFALSIGFASLAFSGFTPTARFGLLTAIGAAASLPADLILLPSFLLPQGPTIQKP